MNKQGFLFLFFLFGLMDFFGSNLFLISAQDSGDSLRYYHNVIVRPENSTDLNSAFLFFEKDTQKKLDKGEIISAVQNLRRIAIGQFELGFFHESEATAVKGINLLEGLENNEQTKESKRGLANHLGLVYRKLNLFDEALQFYGEALNLASGATDSVVIINNISNVYLDQKKFDLAIANYTLAYRKSKELNDSLRTALALDNLGFAQSMRRMPAALYNMQEALKIRKGNRDIPGMYSSHHHLSEYFISQDNYDKAVEHAEQAYSLAKQLNSASYLENALSLLLDLSDDPKIIEYRKLTDSLSLAKQIQENKYAIIKYNVEKERQNTQMAELQKEREKRYKIIFLSAFLLAVMGAMFILYRKNQQRKRELVQTVQKTEARISKRVHDDLANDVSGVMTFVENKLSASTNIKENLLNFLNDIYLRARDISVANAGVDVSDFPAALKSLVAQYHPKGVSVITSPYSNINWDDVPEHKKIQLYKCLQELLVNSKKHSKATLISIAFNRKGKKNEIVYSDNGIGFDVDNIVLGGLNNVETRMTEIEGSFSFESDEGKGFKASLLF